MARGMLALQMSKEGDGTRRWKNHSSGEAWIAYCTTHSGPAVVSHRPPAALSCGDDYTSECNER